MSVEYCVVRVAPALFQQLQQEPDLLQGLMDGFFATTPGEHQTHVDARDIIRGAHRTTPSTLRMLYLDEFTTSLLVNFMEEDSAFFVALVGWGTAETLHGISYGHGDISFYAPAATKVVSSNLNAYPTALLEARIREQADNFRLAAAGYFADDQAILTHQQTFAGLLHSFYDQAAREGDVVLLLIV